jgi:HD-GYP domain-containing protein (c-di-GMP phosphodiesterase class II)
MLQTAEDVGNAIAHEPGLASWSLTHENAPEGCLALSSPAGSAVLLWPEIWRSPRARDSYLASAQEGLTPLILCGIDADFDRSRGEIESIARALPEVVLLPLPAAAVRLSRVLEGAVEASGRARELAAARLALERARYENDLLIDIGRALGQQRNLEQLLGLILKKARDVTGADAGSVYVVEGDQDEPSQGTLRFMESQNDSRPIESLGFCIPISASSIVGACVLAAQVIDIPDLYHLDSPGVGNNPWGFVHDRSFDQRNDYQTRSMLTIPLISARGHVIGVVQLINRRARGVTRLEGAASFDLNVERFDAVSINYAKALAAQAGLALENALLYDEVRRLFEGFVHASVTAIEARDPTTSGHSLRVAELTVELARATDRADRGSYADLAITPDELKQIEYAALLHDFGKVGVREHVLVKAEKLYAPERALIASRFEFIRCALEKELLRAKLRYVLDQSRDQFAAALFQLDRDAESRLRELDDFIEFIWQANQPTVLEKAGFEKIVDIASRRYIDVAGVERPYLTAPEVTALSIARGSLTADERREIESHVLHTEKFLKQIPWGRAFRAVPSIASAHHEKLDGSGYPYGLTARQIPTPARMMAISDIFDALTASDRPYKRAVPVEKALDILADEVKAGKLDQELYTLFLEAKVYRIVLSPAREAAT